MSYNDDELDFDFEDEDEAEYGDEDSSDELGLEDEEDLDFLEELDSLVPTEKRKTEGEFKGEVKNLDSVYSEVADNLVENPSEFKPNVTRKLEYPFIEVTNLGEKTALAQIAAIKEYFPKREDTLPLMVAIDDPNDGKRKRMVAGYLALELSEFVKLLSMHEFQIIQHVSEEESFDVTQDFLNDLLLS